MPGLGPLPLISEPPLGPSPAALAVPAGLKAQARVKMSQAVRLLVEALGLLKEVGSDEGRALLSALKALGPVTPDVQAGLHQSEIASLLQAASAVRQAPPLRPGLLGAGAAPSPQIIAGPPMTGMPVPAPMGPGGV